MIPKIQTRGKSFKGLATYLTHDPKAETSKRVAWTHTLNLAHDDVLSAVNSMLWTARAAELLKQEAGIRAGGRETESAVKHVSLNWSPEEKPTQAQMIDATQDFLRHMKWNEHQALLVAHNDKPYAHVHIMLNAVHPETGLRINESFEQRRAQAWALEYERENGRIYCEQRLLSPNEREDSPTRPAWMAFKENEKKFERDEKMLHENSPNLGDEKNIDKIGNSAEWKMLKEIQRRERQGFFAEGKLAFSELRRGIHREVREEFRERWADLYASQKKGGDDVALATTKAELIAEQKAVLEARRDEACEELRQSRDKLYRGLLDDQQDIRHSLRARQEAGLDNGHFLQLIESRDQHKPMMEIFGEAKEHLTAREEGERADPTAFTGSPRHERAGMKSGTDIGASLATGLGFGLLSLFGGIADGLVAAKPDPKPRWRASEPVGPTLFDVAAEDARKRQQQPEPSRDEEEWRKRQRSYGE